MNETSATSASGMSLLPDGIATLTAIHFAIIAVLAVLVVIGLIWGIRAKRSRVKASHDVIAHAEEAGVPPEPVDPDAPDTERPAPGPQSPPRQSQAQTQTRAPVPAAPPPIARPPADPAPAPATPPPAPIREAAAPSTEPAESKHAAEPAIPVPVEAPRAPVPVTAPASARSHADGPVTLLKGLGPKVAAQLGTLCVTTVGEMAALSDSEAQSIDTQLGAFTGRMGRDRWIEQARLLAAGDTAGFEAVFGKL